MELQSIHVELYKLYHVHNKLLIIIIVWRVQQDDFSVDTLCLNHRVKKQHKSSIVSIKMVSKLRICVFWFRERARGETRLFFPVKNFYDPS